MITNLGGGKDFEKGCMIAILQVVTLLVGVGILIGYFVARAFQ